MDSLQMKTIILVLLSVNVFDVHGQNFRNDLFEKASCSDTGYETILSKPVIFESKEKSSLQCAISCGRTIECSCAVFLNSSKTCKHIGNIGTSGPSLPPPDSSNGEGCSVLRKYPSPILPRSNRDTTTRNTLVQRTSEPEVSYTFCDDASWKEVGTNDYQTMSDSKLEMKVKIHDNSSASIHHAMFFVFNASDMTYALQIHNILMLNVSLETFETPLKREFKLYTKGNDILSNYFIEMKGGSFITRNSHSPEISLWRRQKNNVNRVVYEKNNQGDASSLIDIFLKGHRLIQREDTRVGFDSSNGNVYFESPMNVISYTDTGSYHPLYFQSSKFSIKSDIRFVTRTYFQGSEPFDLVEDTFTFDWEMDKCWEKLPLAGDAHDHVSELKDTILSGKDVRLILNGSVSTDVTMVTVTNEDVVAVLAYYLPPFNSNEKLAKVSFIHFSLISQSKRMALCEVKFQRSKVEKVTFEKYPSTIEWVGSKRPWSKVFKLSNNSDVLYGSLNGIDNSVISMNNIRVCAEMPRNISHCHGIKAITKLEDSHLLFQTPAVLRPDFNENGTFSGIQDQDCRRHVWLFSTKGKMERASYIIGQADGPDAVVSESFVTITWYSDG